MWQPNECIIQLKSGKLLKFAGPFIEYESIDVPCLLLKNLDDFKLRILKPSVIEECSLTRSKEPILLKLQSEESFESYKSRFAVISKELESERLSKAVIATEKIFQASTLPRLNYINTNDDRIIFSIQNNDLVFFGATPDEFLEISKDHIFTLYSVAGTSLTSSVDKLENEVSVSSMMNELKKFGINSIEVTQSVARSGELYHVKSMLKFRANLSLLSSLIDAIYPPSTIFGYPIKNALRNKQFLMPPSGYGYYGSLVGVLGEFDDGLLFRSICLIRGLEVKNHLVRVIAGSGIIKNRSAEQEFEECQLKLKSILGSIGAS